MLLIRTCLENEVNNLVKELPDKSFQMIRPKHIDGAEIVQLFIEVTQIVAPAAIAAFSSYLVANRFNPTVRISWKIESDIEIEIKSKLNDKKLLESELYKTLLEILKKNKEENDGSHN